MKTLEECKAVALRYKTKTEFAQKAHYTWRISKLKGWDTEVCAHMPAINKPPKLTLQECQSIALKYKTRSLWHAGHPNSYNKARRANWMEQCCSHMPPPRNIKRKVKNRETGQVYSTVSNAAKALGVTKQAVSYAIYHKIWVKGFSFEFVD